MKLLAIGHFKSFSESYENHSSPRKNDYRRCNFHGVQSHLSIHALETESGGEWFGSRNMLFVGDLLQQQPVSGNPVFEGLALNHCFSNLGVQRLLTFGTVLLFMMNSPLTSDRTKTKSSHQCWIV